MSICALRLSVVHALLGRFRAIDPASAFPVDLARDLCAGFGVLPRRPRVGGTPTGLGERDSVSAVEVGAVVESVDTSTFPSKEPLSVEHLVLWPSLAASSLMTRSSLVSLSQS